MRSVVGPPAATAALTPASTAPPPLARTLLAAYSPTSATAAPAPHYRRRSCCQCSCTLPAASSPPGAAALKPSAPGRRTPATAVRATLAASATAANPTSLYDSSGRRDTAASMTVISAGSGGGGGGATSVVITCPDFLMTTQLIKRRKLDRLERLLRGLVYLPREHAVPPRHPKPNSNHRRLPYRARQLPYSYALPPPASQARPLPRHEGPSPHLPADCSTARRQPLTQTLGAPPPQLQPRWLHPGADVDLDSDWGSNPNSAAVIPGPISSEPPEPEPGSTHRLPGRHVTAGAASAPPPPPAGPWGRPSRRRARMRGLPWSPGEEGEVAGPGPSSLHLQVVARAMQAAAGAGRQQRRLLLQQGNARLPPQPPIRAQLAPTATAARGCPSGPMVPQLGGLTAVHADVGFASNPVPAVAGCRPDTALVAAAVAGTRQVPVVPEQSVPVVPEQLGGPPQPSERIRGPPPAASARLLRGLRLEGDRGSRDSSSSSPQGQRGQQQRGQQQAAWVRTTATEGKAELSVPAGGPEERVPLSDSRGGSQELSTDPRAVRLQPGLAGAADDAPAAAEELRVVQSQVAAGRAVGAHLATSRALVGDSAPGSGAAAVVEGIFAASSASTGAAVGEGLPGSLGEVPEGPAAAALLSPADETAAGTPAVADGPSAPAAEAAVAAAATDVSSGQEDQQQQAQQQAQQQQAQQQQPQQQQERGRGVVGDTRAAAPASGSEPPRSASRVALRPRPARKEAQAAAATTQTHQQAQVAAAAVAMAAPQSPPLSLSHRNPPTASTSTISPSSSAQTSTTQVGAPRPPDGDPRGGPRPPQATLTAMPPPRQSQPRSPPEPLPPPRTDAFHCLLHASDLTASLHSAPSWVHVARLVHRWPHMLNAISLVAAFKRLAKCCQVQMLDTTRTDSTALLSMLQHLCFQAEQHLPSMGPREVSGVLFSLASLQYYPPPHLAQGLIDAFMARLDRANALDCAHLMWAAGRLGWALGRDDMEAVWRQLRCRLQDDRPSLRSLVVLLNSATKLGMELPPSQLLWLEGALVSRAAQLTSQDVCNTLTSLARLVDGDQQQRQQRQQQQLHRRQAQQRQQLQELRQQQQHLEGQQHLQGQQQVGQQLKQLAQHFEVRQGKQKEEEEEELEAELRSGGGDDGTALRPRAETLTALLRRSADVLPDMRGDEPAMVLYSLARLRFQPPPGYVKALLSRCASQCTSCSPAGLSLALWAAGHLHPPPTRTWMSALLAETLRRLPALTPLGLSCVIHGIGRAGYDPEPDVAAALLKRASELLPEFSPRQLASTVWALAHLPPDCAPTHGSAFWAALSRRCRELGLRSFSPQGLANLLWGLAVLAPRAKLPDRGGSSGGGGGTAGSAVGQLLEGVSVRELFSVLDERLYDMDGMELSMTVWSLARLRCVPGGGWVDRAVSHSSGMLRTMPLRGLSAFVHALTWILSYTPGAEAVTALEEEVLGRVAHVRNSLVRRGLLSRLAVLRKGVQRVEREAKHDARVDGQADRAAAARARRIAAHEALQVELKRRKVEERSRRQAAHKQKKKEAYDRRIAAWIAKGAAEGAAAAAAAVVDVEAGAAAGAATAAGALEVRQLRGPLSS